ncbi:MAG: tetratricopeptide repeat protein [Porphyrobacter sp.]|nr:tetratricopeptide repeat protein [Porphyrobacter sp.]
MSLIALALALTAAPPIDLPTARLAQAPDSDLAAQTLAAGREDEALAVLRKASAENPHDPAVLINLGIAYAQAGNDAKARESFEAALACEDVVELDTADGSATDSRRLARKALRMLARGEFRAAPQPADKLTYRD